MFILKRQDVDISTIQHPKTGQPVPILNYQGQTFRLIQVFPAKQEEEAKGFWRDLTDNRGKACVLLEEPDRFSVWGKIRVEQLGDEGAGPGLAVAPFFVQACLLLLQALYFEIEDLLGARQAGSFQKDISNVFQQWKFPHADSANSIKQWLTDDPFETPQLPSWQEHHLNTLLQELHRLGKQYFGNTSFTGRVMDALQDMPDSERKQFMGWMNQTPLGKLWATG